MSDEDLAKFKASLVSQMISAGMDAAVANHEQVISLAARLLFLEDENDALRSAGRKLAVRVVHMEDKLAAKDTLDELEAKSTTGLN